MSETDICIIGAGIMGSATAYYLSKTTDKQIVLVDQYTVANDYCSSNDTNRVFRYAYGKDEFYTGLAIQSRKLWQQLEQETKLQLLIPSDLLLVQGTDTEWNMFNEESHKTLKRIGLKTGELERKQLEKKYPQFNAERAYTDPYAGILLATKALLTFAREATKGGVKIIENMRVTRITSKDGRPTIEDSKGNRIISKKLLITAGSWSNNFLRKSLVEMTPTRQQLLYFEPPEEQLFAPPRFPVFFADQFYGIPSAGTDAVKISHIGREAPTDPETAKRTVDPEEVDACRQLLRRFIPKLSSTKLVRSRVCLYDMTPDKDFVLGHDPEENNIVYGYGFSGHGFKFAPIIGKTLAQLMIGNDTGIDLTRFSPDRNPVIR
jgi:monomeric sarcosine oxidase